MHQFNITVQSHGTGGAHHQIGDEQGVVDEDAAGAAVLGRPIKVGAYSAVMPGQELRTAGSQAVDHRRGAADGIHVELRPRTVKEAVVIKRDQTLDQLLVAAMGDQPGDVRRAQKSVFADVLDDGEVVGGELDRLGRGACEARPAHLRTGPFKESGRSRRRWLRRGLLGSFRVPRARIDHGHGSGIGRGCGSRQALDRPRERGSDPWHFTRIIGLDPAYGPRFADHKVSDEMIETRWVAGQSAVNEMRQVEEEWLLGICRDFGVSLRIRRSR